MKFEKIHLLETVCPVITLGGGLPLANDDSCTKTPAEPAPDGLTIGWENNNRFDWLTDWPESWGMFDDGYIPCG